MSSTLLVDDALVVRSQAGDEDARCELAGRVRPMVQRYAGRFFADPARAEDLAQIVLMKAFARVGDVRSPEAFPAWLLRITRNECLNELSRLRANTVPLSTFEERGVDLEAPAGGEDDPEEAMVRSQLQDAVRRVVAGLPEHYRRTLTMRALEDRSYEDVSEALGVPVTVARLWYCRARKRFRTAFIAAIVERRDLPDGCRGMAADIAELIEGTLARTARDTLQGHLSDCHVCRQTEEELRTTAFRTPARSLLFALGAAAVPGRLLRGAGRHAASVGGRALRPAGIGFGPGLASGAVGIALIGAGTGVLSPAQDARDRGPVTPVSAAVLSAIAADPTGPAAGAAWPGAAATAGMALQTSADGAPPATSPGPRIDGVLLVDVPVLDAVARTAGDALHGLGTRLHGTAATLHGAANRATVTILALTHQAAPAAPSAPPPAEPTPSPSASPSPAPSSSPPPSSSNGAVPPAPAAPGAIPGH